MVPCDGLRFVNFRDRLPQGFTVVRRLFQNDSGLPHGPAGTPVAG